MDQEIPSVRVSMVGRIWDLLKKKKIPLTTVHYNALLRVHLENGHKFTPEQVIEEMKTNGASPDKETFQCLISRYCQDGNIDGASRVLQMMKTMIRFSSPHDTNRPVDENQSGSRNCFQHFFYQKLNYDQN